MAVYPEGNPGVHPLDPETTVGLFRLLYGDTESEPFDPVEPGFQDYEELSDTEISAFLKQAGDSPTRAIGYLYLALSGQAAKQSRTVKDYDLSVDLTKRSNDLRETAQRWFSAADSEDAGLGEDAFDIVPVGPGCQGIPEGSPVMYGRKYVIGRSC